MAEKTILNFFSYSKMFVAFESVREQLCGRVRSLKSYLPNSKINDIVDCISSKPLWMKLVFSSGVISYIYVRYRWTALNDCGVGIIEPRFVSNLNLRLHLVGQ